MHRPPPFLVLLVLACCACTKEDGATTGTATGSDCATLEGITQRDVMGAPSGTWDGEDWRFLDEWTPQIEALFAGRPAPPLAASAADTLIAAGFPNPSEEQYMLILRKQPTSYIDLRVIDRYCQLRYARDGLLADQFLLAGDSMAVPPGELVRVYYRIVHADGTAHQGHGDLQRAP